MTITLLNIEDEVGTNVVSRRIIDDPVEIRAIRACLLPGEPSRFADGMMRFPSLGRLDFQTTRGSIRVEFPEAGKNPLCYRIGETAFLRGGPDYPNHQRDHKALYGVDSEWIDESIAFYFKLKSLCDGKPAR